MVSRKQEKFWQIKKLMIEHEGGEFDIDKEKKKLERAAKACPVEASLNEKIKKKVEFFFHN